MNMLVSEGISNALQSGVRVITGVHKCLSVLSPGVVVIDIRVILYQVLEITMLLPAYSRFFGFCFVFIWPCRLLQNFGDLLT